MLNKSLKLAVPLLVITLLLGCAGQNIAQPQLNPTQVFESALLTATFAIVNPTQTLTPAPTNTPAPTPTPTITPWVGPPPELPATFQTTISGAVGPDSSPHTYIADPCQFLLKRLDPNNSSPGTVVMPVMFHSVAEDYRVLTQAQDVHHEDMVRFLEHARETGWQTITTRELVAFLENNAKIPARSLIIIVDDRRPGVVREQFWPYLQEYGWTLTLGWLIGPTDGQAASYLKSVPDENFTSLWQQMESYNSSGLLDIQDHGFNHMPAMAEGTSDEYIRHELVDSRKVLQDHFYCKNYQTGEIDPNCTTDQPLAIIWPGGSFSKRSVEIARQAGYHVGFTTSPRGPVMFNWIPQGDTNTNTPSWLPEGYIGDPLMTLPRYWSLDAAERLDDVANVGEEAALAASQSHQQEVDYYNYNCQKNLGPLPTLSP